MLDVSDFKEESQRELETAKSELEHTLRLYDERRRLRDQAKLNAKTSLAQHRERKREAEDYRVAAARIRKESLERHRLAVEEAREMEDRARQIEVESLERHRSVTDEHDGLSAECSALMVEKREARQRLKTAEKRMAYTKFDTGEQMWLELGE